MIDKISTTKLAAFKGQTITATGLRTMKWILELVLQLIAALVVGVVFATICGVLGSEILTRLDVQTIPRDWETTAIFGGNPEAWEPAMRAFLSGVLGFAVGNPVGVYLMGKRRRVRGSFWLAFVCCILSGGVAMSMALVPANEPLGMLGFLLVLFMPVFAVVCFNLPMVWTGGEQGQSD